MITTCIPNKCSVLTVVGVRRVFITWKNEEDEGNTKTVQSCGEAFVLTDLEELHQSLGHKQTYDLNYDTFANDDITKH